MSGTIRIQRLDQLGAIKMGAKISIGANDTKPRRLVQSGDRFLSVGDDGNIEITQDYIGAHDVTVWLEDVPEVVLAPVDQVADAVPTEEEVAEQDDVGDAVPLEEDADVPRKKKKGKH